MRTVIRKRNRRQDQIDVLEESGSSVPEVAVRRIVEYDLAAIWIRGARTGVAGHAAAATEDAASAWVKRSASSLAGRACR